MTVTGTHVTQYFRIKIKDGEKINRWTYRTRQLVRKRYRRMWENKIDAYYKSLKERRLRRRNTERVQARLNSLMH